MAPSKRNQVTSDDEPVFFHGDKARPYGIFSQWHKCDFVDPKYPGVTFDCAEQYMMYGKAQVFDSPDIAAKILSVKSPKAQKALGREIKGFTDDVWNPARLGVVKRSSYLKFSQNEKLKKVLLETGNRYLVEASPKDRIWGIGYSAAAAKKVSRDRWGQNLLGIALMYARSKIRAEEAEEEEQDQEEEDIQPDTIKESIEQTAYEEAEDRSESPPAIKKPATKKRKRNSSAAEEVEDDPKPKKTPVKRLKSSPLPETLDSDDEDGKHNSITDDEAPESPRPKKTAPKKTALKKKLVKKIPSPPSPKKAPEADDEDEDNINKGLNQILNMAKGLKAQTSNDNDDNDDEEEESPAVKKKAEKKANDDLLEMLTKKAMEDSIINGKY
ncbi:DUF1768-domain-containing protein [Aureobasidium pullulans]|uniref:DUF1768-domain-containing protein n=1 Tax=Aureobasidium pullulans TaxID=5580 RepID=A0A4V4JY64_AURPU|nr:DUF1768-domain-containing protein [Aureobasidium pullulans]